MIGLCSNINQLTVLFFDVRGAYSSYKTENNLMSEVVRCGASQKQPPRDSTRSTALGGCLFGMCRRLRLIISNYR
jgi:hypothetical protein